MPTDRKIAQEVARDGIHVNLVVPAPVETAMLDTVTFEMHVIQAKGSNPTQARS